MSAFSVPSGRRVCQLVIDFGIGIGIAGLVVVSMIFRLIIITKVIVIIKNIKSFLENHPRFEIIFYTVVIGIALGGMIYLSTHPKVT